MQSCTGHCSRFIFWTSDRKVLWFSLIFSLFPLFSYFSFFILRALCLLFSFFFLASVHFFLGLFYWFFSICCWSIVHLLWDSLGNAAYLGLHQRWSFTRLDGHGLWWLYLIVTTVNVANNLWCCEKGKYAIENDCFCFYIPTVCNSLIVEVRQSTVTINTTNGCSMSVF